MFNVMDRFKNNIGSIEKNEDGADIVQTILITVLFVVMVLIVGSIIYNAVRGQADRVGDCLKTADPTKAGSCSAS